jgi:hypothetical protein
MAFAASDGKKFTNRPPMRAHEASMAKRSMAGGAGPSVGADPLQQPAQGEQEMGQEDGSAVAAEHGPAQEVHTMHDHEGGMHHVHSIHPDGHEHHSDHASAEEAHEHGKKLAGGGEHEEENEGGMEHEHEPEYE